MSMTVGLKTAIYRVQSVCRLEIKTGSIDLSLLHVNWGLSSEPLVAQCDLRAAPGILQKHHRSPVLLTLVVGFPPAGL